LVAARFKKAFVLFYEQAMTVKKIYIYLAALISASLVTFASLPGCEDTGLVDIYNTYTETYRKTQEDKMYKDSCIAVKILNTYTNLPLKGISLKLLTPAGDTMFAESDKDGIANFPLYDIRTGEYSILAAYTLNNITYSAAYRYSLYNKSLHSLSVYLPVKELK
jgi:hypothetical protein